MADLNLLQITSEFCKRKGLPVPSTVVGAADDQILQIWGLLNEGIQDIASRYNHQELQASKTFTHAGGTDYLAYDLSALSGWKFIIPQSLWNITGRLPVAGPLSMVQWQTLTTMLVNQALYSYILYGNGIHIFGQPTVLTSVTFGFKYQSRNGVTDTVAPLDNSSYGSDTATPKINSDIILADLKWRWAREKGLPYAEDQRASEEMLTNLVGSQDQGVLVLDDQPQYAGFPPGVIVPAGNWNV